MIITVITSTFNCAKDLEITASAIRKQTIQNQVQWIIADGGSTDGTLDVIQRNLDIISFWLSEKDEGIYDAWNKAIKHANGNWIQFIGAGDELANNNTLEIALQYLETAYPKHDLVYGRLQYLSENDRQVIDEVGAPWADMKGKWEYFRPKLPIHPEVFHHISLFKEDQPFDTSYKIAGDSHFLMRAIKDRDPLYIPVLIDKMPLGGKTGHFSIAYQASLELKRACRELGFKPPLKHIVYETIKTQAKRFICYFFTPKIANAIANFYRTLSGKKKWWP